MQGKGGKKTRLLLRFGCESVPTLECVQRWMAMMLLIPFPLAIAFWWDCYLLVTSNASLHTSHRELLPACHFVQPPSIAAYWGKVWYNELHVHTAPLTHLFVLLPFLSNYIYCCIYSSYPKACLFHSCVSGCENWWHWTYWARQTCLFSEREAVGVCIPICDFLYMFLSHYPAAFITKEKLFYFCNNLFQWCEMCVREK